MALTAASASSRRAAFLLAYPRSKEIPVLYLPFKNVYMGIGLKSCVHAYQRTPQQSHLQMALSGFCLQAIISFGAWKKPSSVCRFQNHRNGNWEKNRTHFWFGKSGSDYIGLVRETGLDSHGSPPLSGHTVVWFTTASSSPVFALVFLGSKIKTSVLTEVLIWCSRWNWIRTRSACFRDLFFDEFYTLVIGKIAGIPASPILWARTTNWNFYLCCHVIT